MQIQDEKQKILNLLTQFPLFAGGAEGFSSFASTILNGFAETLNTQEDLDLINQFVTDHSSDLQGRISSISDSIKKAELNLQWNQLHADNIINWLDAKYGNHNGGDDDNNAGNLITSANGIIILSLSIIYFVIAQF